MKPTLFTTSSVTAKEQFSYWNEAVCSVFTELDCQTVNRRMSTQDGYQGSLEFWDLGEVQLTHVVCDASHVKHGLVQVAKADEEVNLLHLQIVGESLNAQDGREAYLRPGDFTVCNSSQPYFVHFDNSIEMLVMRIPEPVLRSR